MHVRCYLQVKIVRDIWQTLIYASNLNVRLNELSESIRSNAISSFMIMPVYIPNVRLHTKCPATAPTAYGMTKGESDFGACIVDSKGKTIKVKMDSLCFPDGSDVRARQSSNCLLWIFFYICCLWVMWPPVLLYSPPLCWIYLCYICSFGSI